MIHTALVALVAARIALTARLEARARVRVTFAFAAAAHHALASDSRLHTHGSTKSYVRHALPTLKCLFKVVQFRSCHGNGVDVAAGVEHVDDTRRACETVFGFLDFLAS